VHILMQMTADRHADLPDVPLAGEFAKDDDNRRVLALFVARQKYGRPFLAPPGTPDAVVDAYQAGFAKLVTDADFLRDTEQARVIVKMAPGEEVTALVNSLHGLPRTVLDKASTLIRSIAQ